ncbi:alpha-L-glutamate ligase [Sphingomonas sp.]|uniref:ATP-grasp domain-containing protein n=1 Tax=Sphingomonas sp. TaxID=28214 RepID=UPI0025FA196D|nr:alpha-L-glutamate ligase [Sphingomonas sp.]MBV9528650.1 alpha-L-glutamate ligase [Sphingomonas sp.]
MSPSAPSSAHLAVLYEHPQWFQPLFAALDRYGLPYVPVQLSGHSFDPAAVQAPAPLILGRVAQSSFLREPEHPIFYAAALLDHWSRSGARVLNGADVLAIDSSKARQLSLIASLGLAIPQTRVVHRARDLVAAAEGMTFPLLVKANIGGSGAGIVRYSSLDELRASVADGTAPVSVDRVLLLQDYVPARGGTILRIETLGGRFLYAIEVETGGDNFDLCPADACVTQPGRKAIRMTVVTPSPDIILAAERIVQAAGMDLGGVELVIDDRDGVARFYDINAMSNYVADPLNVLGWDPHDKLVGFLEQQSKGRVAA